MMSRPNQVKCGPIRDYIKHCSVSHLNTREVVCKLSNEFDALLMLKNLQGAASKKIKTFTQKNPNKQVNLYLYALHLRRGTSTDLLSAKLAFGQMYNRIVQRIEQQPVNILIYQLNIHDCPKICDFDHIGET